MLFLAMIRKIILILLVLGLSGPADSQEVPGMASDSASHLRISLITCGPGFNEVWEVFGHTAIRIVDSIHHTDLVYNYGTFDGFDANFEINFMRGKLLYTLSVYPFREFMPEYVQTKRSVYEQLLLMTDVQKSKIRDMLDINAEPANRAYKYDFFFDNCATRIRDIFPKAAGNEFVYGQVLSKEVSITFREIINRYFYTKQWVRLGVNILLGSKIDKVMTDKDVMFLPDYLSKGLGTARMDGQKVAAPSLRILEGIDSEPEPVNFPLILTWSSALLTIAGLYVKRLKVLGKGMSFLVLLVTGLLGCLILVMWFGTNHEGCRDNYNVLWALPTNLILAFGRPKGAPRYAMAGIGLVLVTLLLHVFRVQGLLFMEMFPILLTLVCIYHTIIRQSKLKSATLNA